MKFKRDLMSFLLNLCEILLLSDDVCAYLKICCNKSLLNMILSLTNYVYGLISREFKNLNSIFLHGQVY